MKAFVTGGTGFIGSHLVEALAEKGFQVTCLVRKTSSLKWLASLPVSFVEGDLRDEDGLQRSLKGQDYIFHVAGLTKAIHPESFDLVNHLATRNLVRATLKANQSLERFVYFSSLSAVGSSPTDQPLKDSPHPHPITPYGVSKLKAEEFILQHTNELPATILRPSIVYGPRERDLYHYFQYVQKGWMPIVGSGDLLLSLVYVADLIRATLLSLETRKTIGGVYFVSDNTPRTWPEIGQTIASSIQTRLRTIHIPIPIFYLACLWEEGLSRIRRRPPLLSREKVREVQEKYWICDSMKAREDFGYTPKYSLEEGITKTARWYLEQGWL